MFVSRQERRNPTGWLKELVQHAVSLITLFGKHRLGAPDGDDGPSLMEEFLYVSVQNTGITAMADGITEGEAQMASMYETR